MRKLIEGADNVCPHVWADDDARRRSFPKTRRDSGPMPPRTRKAEGIARRWRRYNKRVVTMSSSLSRQLPPRNKTDAPRHVATKVRLERVGAGLAKRTTVVRSGIYAN